MPLLKKEFGRNDSSVALLLIDVINDLDFDRADDLLAQAVPMASKIAALKREAALLQIPTVYVNDNFGQWKSDFRHTVELRAAPATRAVGRSSRALRPERLRLFRAQAGNIPASMQRRSMFCSNISKWTRPDHHGNRAANICVALFTANDAYMRDYRLCVPADCVASNTTEETEYSLRQMKTF